jgi:hypothetical protein
MLLLLLSPLLLLLMPPLLLLLLLTWLVLAPWILRLYRGRPVQAAYAATNWWPTCMQPRHKHAA